MLVLFFASLILFGIILFSRNQALKIVFFDVGQGDAIFISQGSNQVLIDGGPDLQTELEKLGKYIPFWDRTIEVVMATHPDQDHIDGITGVMKNYRIGEVIDSSAESSSQVYKNYLELIKEKKINRLKGIKGMNIKLAEVNIEILYPDQGTTISSKNTNAGSLLARLTYGQNSFLFTGDFPSDKDTEILTSGTNLSANVLKVAHHGSKYSTSVALLEKVNPRTAIISVGASNRYGHPSGEVIERLESRNISILRTDIGGDIVYDCPNPESLCLVENR